MGASDRFLFTAGTALGTSRVLAESAPARQPVRPTGPSRPSTVLQRCQGPVQLSLFAGLEAQPRAEGAEPVDPPALLIDRRIGGRRSTD